MSKKLNFKPVLTSVWSQKLKTACFCQLGLNDMDSTHLSLVGDFPDISDHRVNSRCLVHPGILISYFTWLKKSQWNEATRCLWLLPLPLNWMVWAVHANAKQKEEIFLKLKLLFGGRRGPGNLWEGHFPFATAKSSYENWYFISPNELKNQPLGCLTLW